MSRVLGPYRVLMAAAGATAKSAAKAAPVSTKASSKPAVGLRLLALKEELPVSPELGKFLGVKETSRPEVFKKIWAYIKEHHLQNPSNKREIICDEKLKSIFDGKDKVNMFEIAKHVSRHFIKAN